MRLVTLCIPLSGDNVLLGMKKKGFGEGRWTGFGGKVQEGETVAEAAARELQEECGIIAHHDTLRKVAVIDFYFADTPEWNQQMHVFTAESWSGKPEESDEMIPAWYPRSALPFEKMWVDDELWLGRVLAGEVLRGEVRFKDQGVIASSSFEAAAVLP
jgi:8-oxo-dGTP diphosphatase